MNEDYEVVYKKKYSTNGSILKVKWNNRFLVKFITTGKTSDQFSVQIKGSHKSETIVFNDTYFAFKSCILEFINGIKNNCNVYSEKELYLFVKLIEVGT